MTKPLPTTSSTTIVNRIRLLLLVIGSIIAVDCLVLFAFLKFNFGTIVPFTIAIIFLVHAVYWQTIQRIINTKVICKWQLKRAWQCCWLAFGLWLLSFAVFIISIVSQIHASEAQFEAQAPSSLTSTTHATDVRVVPIDAIIVLGAGVNGDTPTPALASRLDKAASVWKNHAQRTQQANALRASQDSQPSDHKKAMIITSGGVGIGRTRSEASVMAEYLVTTHHIDPQYILLEEKSTSTEENLLFSKNLVTSDDDIGVNHGIKHTINNPVVIVTNDFHTVRAKAIAHKQGYANVRTLASKTPLSIRANSWFREYFAFISGWLLREY